MEELVKIIGADIFTDSLVIAKGTENEHRAVQQLVRNYKSDISDFGKVTFQMLSLESGQKMKVYLLNEQQATFLISLMKNTKIVVAFKKELVRQFYAMRQYILEHQSSQWQQTRLEAKNIRKMETAEIKELVTYAKAQGSKNAEKYYMALSKLANKTVGLETGQRERASIMQLNTLALVENIINHVIQDGIQRGTPYKGIYSACKQRLEEFQEITFFNAVQAIEAKERPCVRVSHGNR